MKKELKKKTVLLDDNLNPVAQANEEVFLEEAPKKKAQEVTLTSALEVAISTDPRLKNLEKCQESLNKIVNRINEEIDDMKFKDLDMALKALIKFKEHTLKDYSLLTMLISKMSPEDKEIFKALYTKFKLIKEQAKNKDPEEIFKKGG